MALNVDNHSIIHVQNALIVFMCKHHACNIRRCKQILATTIFLVHIHYTVCCVQCSGCVTHIWQNVFQLILINNVIFAALALLSHRDLTQPNVLIMIISKL